MKVLKLCEICLLGYSTSRTHAVPFFGNTTTVHKYQCHPLVLATDLVPLCRPVTLQFSNLRDITLEACRLGGTACLAYR